MIGFPQRHYSILGVNNRNLKTMEVDLNTTMRMAGLVEKPKEIIAESGIKTRSDVKKLIRVGVGGVLIGQTLCQSDSIEDKFRELFSYEGD
jgi:indole-3-glycerol phosphate synthase